MAGDHKCPVCGSTFTRSQHVARHMRSHTGDRPYKCVHCGDQFARSDLLSRHVNKCHSQEPKSGAASGSRARKGRQLSNQSAASRPSFSAASTTDLNPPGPLLFHPHAPQPELVPATDPYATHHALHPHPHQLQPQQQQQQLHQPPPPSSSVLYQPYVPQSSTSHDGLHQQSLVYPVSSAVAAAAAAAAHYNRDPALHLHNQPSSLYSSHYQQPAPQHIDPGYPLFKDPSEDPASAHAQGQPGILAHQNPNAFQDLPTPLAYSYKPRTSSNASSSADTSNSSSAFSHPNPYALVQASYVHQPNHDPQQHQHQHHQQHHQPPLHSQSQHHLVAASTSSTSDPHLGPEGFSSAFGLMSLEDPAVLAGISDGVPFFDNNTTPQNHPDLHSLLPPTTSATHHANNPHADAINWSHFVEPSNLSPRSREREANTLRDLWSAFLRDPTNTGMKPDGTEVGRPDFPTPSLHRRSSSFSGQSRSTVNGSNPGHGIDSTATSGYPIRPASMVMPGPQQTLAGGPHVVAQLEAQAARDPRQPYQQPPTAYNKSANPVSHNATVHGADTLKSYEEAILARKAPELKLPPKMKSRDSASSTSSTATIIPLRPAVLPVISQSNRSIPGNNGGVASLATLQMPSIAAASSVPLGSTPNQGLAALQQQGHSRSTYERPLLPMPKPRSRPSTATDHYGDVSPTSSNPNSTPSTPLNRSAPSSRPGTSSGQYSQSDSRPGTSSGLPSDENRPTSSHSSPRSGGSTTTGFVITPLVGTMPPPSQVPQPMTFVMNASTDQGRQFAEYAAASANAASLSSSSVSGSKGLASRPSYKRLASQILEPAITKRPHIRRGDTADETALDDEDDEDENGPPGHGHESSAESNSVSRGTSFGSSGPALSANGRSSFGSGTEDAFPSMRRMSEPASYATRMYPRPDAQAQLGPAVRDIAMSRN